MNKFVSVVVVASVTAFMACSDDKKSGSAPCILGADCSDEENSYSSSSQTSSKKSSSSYSKSSSSSFFTSSESENDKGKNGQKCDVRVSEYASLPTCDESTLGLTAYLEDEGYICICKVDEFWGGEVWSRHILETSCEEYVSEKDRESLKSSSSVIFGFKGSFGRLIDNRDGKEYKTVTIGTQTWMAENLNYVYVADGVSACDDEECESFCYEDDCEINGRYYEMGVVLDKANYFNSENDWWNTIESGTMFRSICPEGWRLPTLDDWNKLYVAIDSAYTGLQAVGYENWPEATNIYGFSAVPAGIEYSQLYEWRGVGEAASFWTVCPETNRENSLSKYTYCWWIIAPTGMGSSIHSGSMADSGSSIRCIKD